jgi:hypothetical protein
MSDGFGSKVLVGALGQREVLGQSDRQDGRERDHDDRQVLPRGESPTDGGTTTSISAVMRRNAVGSGTRTSGSSTLAHRSHPQPALLAALQPRRDRERRHDHQQHRQRVRTV